MNNTLHYQGCPLDRGDALRRHPDQLEQRWHSAQCRLVLLHQGKNLFYPGTEQAPETITPVFVHPQTISDLLRGGTNRIYLGSDANELAYFALALDAEQATVVSERLAAKFIDLRSTGRHLSHQDAALLAYARGMLYWHQQTRFCSVCATPVHAESGGHVLQCSNTGCAQTFFPRTDPAVIMLVERVSADGTRQCLLGRHPNWPPGSLSTLAGFVEPGESLEEAVRREVFEEAGIRVGQVGYFASQPWPFPASIMLGFFAQADTDTIAVDPHELAEAGWFSAEEVRSFGDWGDETKKHRLPSTDSIARMLINTWLEE